MRGGGAGGGGGSGRGMMMMMFSTFLSQVVGPMWLRNERVRLLSCNRAGTCIHSGTTSPYASRVTARINIWWQIDAVSATSFSLRRGCREGRLIIQNSDIHVPKRTNKWQHLFTKLKKNKNIHPLPPFCFHSLVLQPLKYQDKKGRQADRHIRQHDTRNWARDDHGPHLRRMLYQCLYSRNHCESGAGQWYVYFF